MNNTNLLIGIVVVVLVIILGYVFFWNDATAPDTTPLDDSELPDRSGNDDSLDVDTSGSVQLQY